MLSILVSGSKQPDERIDVYLRELVDDLQTLWNPGVKEVWDEFEHKDFTLHAMLFTTINDNPAHRNLFGQSERKGEAWPHCLEETCSLWLRKLKKFVFLRHLCFLPKKHPYRDMDCQFDGGKGESNGVFACVRNGGPLASQRHQNYKGVTKEDHPSQKKKWNNEEEDGQGIWNKKSILWELEY